MNTLTRRDGQHRLAWCTLALALIGGVMLRSVWFQDIEWKQDEKWSFQMSQEVGRTQPWPGVGMPTSLGFPNPGLSVWIFVPLGRCVSSPTVMAGVIVFLNIVGLIGFAAAVRAYLPHTEQEPWLWGLSLQAVSPFAVRMSRKIWPPSVLTPLLLLLWISHRHRRSPAGAFIWGLVGALIGQVHLSGWFVAAGLVIGTFIAEKSAKLSGFRHWRFWLIGTVLGLLGAIPWAIALPTSPILPAAGNVNTSPIARVVGYAYSLIGAATSAFPFAFLGLGHDTEAYRIGPIVEGIPTHVPDLVSLFVVLAIAVGILMKLARALKDQIQRWLGGRNISRVDHRPAGDSPANLELFQGGQEDGSTAFYLWCTIGIPAALFLLTTNVYFYHYFFVFCPFLFVLVAVCLLPRRGLLLGVVLAQAIMTCAFLNYIHQNGGTRRGEYGLTYTRELKQ